MEGDRITNTILIVDDQRTNRAVLRQILQGDGYNFIEASGGAEAISLLEKEKIDLVILDLLMPEVSGFDVLDRMGTELRLKNVPIIVVSVLDDAKSIVRALSMGAYDYMIKSQSEESIHLTIHLKVRKLVDLKNAHDKLEKSLDHAKRLSVIDDLTNLYNYRYFKTRLYEEFARSRRYLRPLALIIFDLDNLKAVNDAFGHLSGSKVIAKVGAITEETCRSVDVPVRYGGDEFCVIAPEINLIQGARLAERLRRAIEKVGPELSLGSINVTASLGVASCPADASAEFATEDNLMKAADDSCYQAKKSGKNRIHCFENGRIFPVGEII